MKELQYLLTAVAMFWIFVGWVVVIVRGKEGENAEANCYRCALALAALVIAVGGL